MGEDEQKLMQNHYVFEFFHITVQQSSFISGILVGISRQEFLLQFVGQIHVKGISCKCNH